MTRSSTSTDAFRLGELFCGPGGLSYGIHLANQENKRFGGLAARHVWANDLNVDACRTYRRNIPGVEPCLVIALPVQELDFARLPAVDAVAFGFPCNDYSIVGEHKGIGGSFGPLYAFGVKAVKHFRPKWFIAENVTGLANANEGRTFRRILSELEAAGDGYALNVHLYKFEEYGVPQRRHRIIIVGIQKSLGIQYRVPSPTTAKNPATASAALTRPPISQDAPNHEFTRQSKSVVERLKYIPPGENAWYAKLPRRLRLNVKGARLSQIYRRLKKDEPAYTVTGSGGGGTHVYHWSEPRALTNRERARLQTFPDDFVFEGSKESVRQQIGMAVPPIAAKAIVESILKSFAGIRYASTPAAWEQADDGPQRSSLKRLAARELLASQ